MSDLFEEYGAAILAVLTGAIIIGLIGICIGGFNSFGTYALKSLM